VKSTRAVVLLPQGRLPEALAAFERYRELVGRLKPEEEQLWRELKAQLKLK
jgi:hypothetical protein